MGENEGTQGIHETSKPRVEPMGQKETGATSMFDKEGAIGKQFTSKSSTLLGSTGCPLIYVQPAALSVVQHRRSEDLSQSKVQ